MRLLVILMAMLQSRFDEILRLRYWLGCASVTFPSDLQPYLLFQTCRQLPIDEVNQMIGIRILETTVESE